MRGAKCTISATHHVAVLSWNEIFYPSPPAPSFFMTRACGIVRPCRRRWWRALSRWSRVTGPLTEGSGGMGRKSREGDKNKDGRMRGIRRAWRRRRPITGPLSPPATYKTPPDDAFRNADASALRLHFPQSPRPSLSRSCLIPSTDILTFFQLQRERDEKRISRIIGRFAIFAGNLIWGNLIIGAFEWIKADEFKTASVLELSFK